MKSPWPQEILSTDGTPITVGRSGKCGVTIKHAAVSGTHFQAQSQDGMVGVVDLDSRYGTFVNGARIKTTWLKPGDVLKFANSPPYICKNGRLLLQEETNDDEPTWEGWEISRWRKHETEVHPPRARTAAHLSLGSH